jgi:Bacterial DNA polymerase III alpha NTPase domain
VKNEERGEWPDIDLDLPSGEQREQAIQYVYERYGQLRAAMTANVITYRGRSAVRDVGKALGFEESELKRLADLMPQFEWRDPDDTMRRRFREAGLSPDNPRIAKFFSLTEEILQLPRHLGQHSGGLVVSIFLYRKNLREGASSAPHYAYIVRKSASKSGGTRWFRHRRFDNYLQIRGLRKYSFLRYRKIDSSPHVGSMFFF